MTTMTVNSLKLRPFLAFRIFHFDFFLEQRSFWETTLTHPLLCRTTYLDQALIHHQQPREKADSCRVNPDPVQGSRGRLKQVNIP